MQAFVVIKEILNIRNEPSAATHESFIGELLKGEVVYLEEQEIIGTTPVGATTNLWRRDHLKRFVSAEGVRLLSWEEKKAALIQGLKNYWKKSTGERMTVALIDTGVRSNHPHLRGLIEHINISGDEEEAEFSHGARMAGLMCGNIQNTVMCFAPGIQMVDFKIFHNKETHDLGKNLIEALRLIEKSSTINLVNLSLQFDDTISANQIKTIDGLIQACIKKEKIIVAATGNRICAGNREKKDIHYPGRNQEVITVGALKNNLAVNFTECMENLNVSKTPDCFIEFGSWRFCNLNGINDSDDDAINSSEATAIMTALIALKKSRQPSLAQSDIKRQIKQASTLIQNLKGLQIHKLDINNFLKT